jgi:ABC-type multidrug transport system fused ATPase/permease subunit
MRYLPWMQPALDGVSLVIEPGHKVGICGRTGSGKSSLVMALYRMFPLNSGHVFIDGVDTSTLSLSSLRRSLAIIPQEPVMFHGTIRSNLDPFGIHDDALLWEALEIANLKPFVQEQPEGLLTVVDAAGANFSVGQRQLICLARAFLIKSRILVLDEATAAMDLATDALIQTAIRTHFSERTILTIAHRIDTIIGSDKILVMGAGKVVEYDAPKTLLENPSSAFYQLVHASG